MIIQKVCSVNRRLRKIAELFYKFYVFGDYPAEKQPGCKSLHAPKTARGGKAAIPRRTFLFGFLREPFFEILTLQTPLNRDFL